MCVQIEVIRFDCEQDWVDQVEISWVGLYGGYLF